MASEKTERQNRVREALGRIYDHQPPYFREYLRRFQEDPTSRVFAPLAEAYRKLGRLDEAIQICRDGLEHHPDFHGGRVALAKCLLDKKLVQEARKELERVIHIVPENLLAQRLLGDVYEKLQDSAAALHCFKMALLLSPDDVQLAEKVHRLEKESAVFSGSRTQSQAPSASPKPQQADPSRKGEAQKEDDTVDVDPDFLPTGLWDTSDGQLSALGESGENEDAPEEVSAEALGEWLPNAEEDDMVDDEAFKIQHVSSVFEMGEQEQKKEITTETLGDLYFSQGQFDKALRIFDKLPPSAGVRKKVQDCRAQLGVDNSRNVRARQIALLRAVVVRARQLGQGA